MRAYVYDFVRDRRNIIVYVTRLECVVVTKSHRSNANFIARVRNSIADVADAQGPVMYGCVRLSLLAKRLRTKMSATSPTCTIK
jgi:hypothetical protein